MTLFLFCIILYHEIENSLTKNAVRVMELN